MRVRARDGVGIPAALLMLTTGLLGCAPPPTPPPPASVSLPATTFPNACRGIGLDAILFGSLDDPRITWLITKGGVRKELVWPPRYAARFNPDLEVLNEKATVVFRQGDLVQGGCVKGPAADPGEVILIRPEDLGS